MTELPTSLALPDRGEVLEQLSRQVLDHGRVTLVDHMASDLKVVGAARVSTGKGPEQASKGEDGDRKLITHLMSHGHGTPFEHAVFQFYVKAPLFIVREWQRHRVASYNEQSGRYMELAPEFYVPDHVRVQDPVNKQGSVRYDPADERRGAEDYVRTVKRAIRDSSALAFNTYQTLLHDAGVAREMARMVLPLNLYTSFWFTVNARSLMNFLALRNSPAAQWEIQQYGETLESFFALLMPMTWQAFNDLGRQAP